MTIGALALCAVALTFCLACRDLLRARHDLSHARADLTHVAVDPALASARAAASITSHSPWLSLWVHAPVAGTQIRWARRAAGLTASLLADAAETASGADGTLHGGLTSDGLEQLSSSLVALSREVASARLPPAGGLIGPIHDAASRLVADRSRALADLSNALDGVTALQALVGSSHRYLVIAANNAEMRGAGGMALQAGVITTAGGRITPGPFHSVDDLVLPTAVALPEPFGSVYGFLSPGTEWRNTDSSPNWPVVASVYAEMADAAGLGPVDGVLQIDVPALAAMLDATGPVTVDGVRLGASNVEQFLLHDQYEVLYPGRSEALGGLAVTLLDTLTGHPPSVAALGLALTHAASGRHVLIWSADPAAEATWTRLGVAGALAPDDLLITVQNQTGNKLDWFVHPAEKIAAAGNGRWRITVTVDVPDTTGQPAYIRGSEVAGVAAGGYQAMIAVYLPEAATDVDVTGAPIILVGMDGPLKAVGARVVVPALQHRTVTFEFSLPAGTSVSLLPSGRVPPDPVVVDGRAADPSRPVVVRL